MTQDIRSETSLTSYVFHLTSISIMKTILFTLLTLLFILITTDIIFAQLPGLPGDDPAQAPIDGGLGLLAAAGGAYAYKKLRSDKASE